MCKWNRTTGRERESGGEEGVQPTARKPGVIHGTIPAVHGAYNFLTNWHIRLTFLCLRFASRSPRRTTEMQDVNFSLKFLSIFVAKQIESIEKTNQKRDAKCNCTTVFRIYFITMTWRWNRELRYSLSIPVPTGLFVLCFGHSNYISNHNCCF